MAGGQSASRLQICEQNHNSGSSAVGWHQPAAQWLSYRQGAPVAAVCAAVASRYGCTKSASATSMRAKPAWSAQLVSPKLTTPETTRFSPSSNNAGPPESIAHGCEGAGIASSSAASTELTRETPVRFWPASSAGTLVTPNPTTVKV